MKICIIGAFGFNMIEKTTGGQPVKTRQLYYSLSGYYGEENITYIDTYGWKSHPIKLLTNLFKAAKKCDIIIMLPAHNGVQIFSRLLVKCKKKYGVKIYYDVIGGWLPKKTKNDKSLTNVLFLFDGIWVETKNMHDELVSQGFSNVVVVPNFRKMSIISSDELSKFCALPLKMCTFSRVMRDKGIETAIDAVQRLNDLLGYTAVTLDIYGPVDPSDKIWFDSLKSKFNDAISYKGCVEPAESCSVLRNYFCLLFPTHFFTEGIPGTIIDAYCAGVPVISAKWRSFNDVIDDGKTGIGYEFDNSKSLDDVLLKVAKNPHIIDKMRINCLKKAKYFHEEHALKIILKNLK